VLRNAPSQSPKFFILNVTKEINRIPNGVMGFKIEISNWYHPRQFAYMSVSVRTFLLNVSAHAFGWFRLRIAAHKQDILEFIAVLLISSSS